uniref:C-type lectin domain-containing protein n=1 Tax=Pundamilia nyererei TaxID=303518 RepID=A0A3B4F481_9CICH
MACLQTRAPVLRMSMTILMVSLTVGKGLDIKQPDHCRAVCSNYGKPDCITLNQGEVDFKTAEEACHDRKGELLQLCSKSDKRLFDILSQELFGNYWIGLHLPAGASYMNETQCAVLVTTTTTSSSFQKYTYTHTHAHAHTHTHSQTKTKIKIK